MESMYLTAKQEAKVQEKHEMILGFLEEAYERMEAAFDGPKEALPPEPEYTAVGVARFLIQYGEWLTHSEVMHIVPCLATINGLMEGKKHNGSEEAIRGTWWVKKTPEIMEVLAYV